jgi:hypothetical protein
MDVREFWVGEGVDYKALWDAYDRGDLVFPDKYFSQKQHLLVIEFDNPFDLGREKPVPLFDHEAVYKTIKGLFHDIKKKNLDPREYNGSTPLFLYSVERGSAVYKFLGELRQLIMFGVVLGDEKIMQARQENIQRRIDFIRKNFSGTLDPHEVSRYVTARTTYEMDEALERLMSKGIKSIKISSKSIQGRVENVEPSLIEFKRDRDGS